MALTAMAALAAVTLMLAGVDRIRDARPSSEDEAVLKLHGDDQDESLRSSHGLRSAENLTGPDGGTDALSAREREPAIPPSPAVRQGRGTTSSPRTGDDGLGGTGGRAGRVGMAPVPRPLADLLTSPATTLPPPFYLPGSGTGGASVLGPIATDDEDGTGDDPLPEVRSTDDPEPEHEPHADDPPDRDEEGCPRLDLYPIGGFAEGAPRSFAAVAPMFRAIAPDEWAKPALVCGYALEPWRDLVVQRLVAGGIPDGALITAADGSSIVMRLNEIEWASYRFRYGGGPVGPNLLGYPVGRSEWGHVSIIETTSGGLVFTHPEAIGVPLIGGAWHVWVASGGPDGHMGAPTGIPESAAGPIGADVWVPGIPSTGARQEFTNGWLFLPGVVTDVEAAAQPPDRYQWHDASELGPRPPEPIDYRGQIMQMSGISFYVDRDGTRHWIPTTSAWSCARWDLGAIEYAVRGYELALYPLGKEFVCSDYK